MPYYITLQLKAPFLNPVCPSLCSFHIICSSSNPNAPPHKSSKPVCYPCPTLQMETPALNPAHVSRSKFVILLAQMICSSSNLNLPPKNKNKTSTSCAPAPNPRMPFEVYDAQLKLKTPHAPNKSTETL